MVGLFSTSSVRLSNLWSWFAVYLIKNTHAIRRNFTDGMLFDDATIYGGQLCSHKYVKENKN